MAEDGGGVKRLVAVVARGCSGDGDGVLCLVLKSMVDSGWILHSSNGLGGIGW